jgi:hypothetical protein
MESNPFPATFLEFVDWTIEWFKLRATRAQFAYNCLRICLVVFSAALPALTANHRPVFSTVIAVVVAALAGLDAQFKPGEQWKHHRSMQLALQAMRRDYEKKSKGKVSAEKAPPPEPPPKAQIDPGAENTSGAEKDPFEEFYTEVRALLEAEANQFWQFRITQWSQDKK